MTPKKAQVLVFHRYKTLANTNTVYLRERKGLSRQRRGRFLVSRCSARKRRNHGTASLTSIQLMQCCSDSPHPSHIYSLEIKQSASVRRRNPEIDLQERQSDITVDLGLDGNLDFEVEVKTELQSCGRCDSLALRAADDLSTEDGGSLSRCVLGLWVRHGDAEERKSSRFSFYTNIAAKVTLSLHRCIVPSGNFTWKSTEALSTHVTGTNTVAVQ